MLAHEYRGSHSRRNNFHLINWLRYAFDNNSWEEESNLSAKVLKVNWDVVAELEDKLGLHGLKHDHEAPTTQKCLR